MSVPASVKITRAARVPEFDPALGETVPAAAPTSVPANKLVTIGDSLTHGFQSGAIFNTDLSWPAIVAWEAGIFGTFRRPHYLGYGGLPLNLEYLIRDLERRFGDQVRWYDAALALFEIRLQLGTIVDYWERGPGDAVPTSESLMQNLAVFGFDLRDALSMTQATCATTIGTPHDSLIAPMISHAKERAARRVLPNSATSDWSGLSVIDAAEKLGADGGIETLVVFLGANNALRVVTDLKVVWSGPGYDDLATKGNFTVWDPEHFVAELNLLAARVRKINAQNVIWTTVPHVTIAPIARGIGRKVRVGSRYFPFYTRPWIADTDFDATRDPHITENDARAVDSAIDQYNDAITSLVRDARLAGKNWFLLDVAGMLDRLAARRYQDDPNARPAWWTPYPLPPDIASLTPRVDSRFFSSGESGRVQGGLFSLDGVHPTTITYGIVAQEMINIMQRAGVRFFAPDGKTERTGAVSVDFKRLILADTLISDPPRSLSSDLGTIGWINAKIDAFSRLLG